jgi:hypothetical protein
MRWGFVQPSAGSRASAELAEALLYDEMSRPTLPRDIRSLSFEFTLSMTAIDDRVLTRKFINRFFGRFGQRVCLLS